MVRRLSPHEQHAKNAADERRWMADAARDQRNCLSLAKQQDRAGNHIRAQFFREESHNAGSWRGKRKGVLNRELQGSGRR